MTYSQACRKTKANHPASLRVKAIKHWTGQVAKEALALSLLLVAQLSLLLVVSVLI